MFLDLFLNSMIDWLREIDTALFLSVNSHTHDSLDFWIFWLSSRIIWIPFYLSLLYAVVLSFGWRTALLTAIFAGVAVGCADQISASLIRPIVERLRPAHLENPVSPLVHIVGDYRGGRYGFPSCHAANTFALAMFTSLVFRRRVFTVAIFLWALMICYTRLYLGVHYPGDILAGASIGSVSGFAFYLIWRKTAGKLSDSLKRQQPRACPTGTWDKPASSFRVHIAGREFRERPTVLPLVVMMLTIVVCGACTIR